MLGGFEGTEELLDAYGVDYVVVGPIERRAGVSEEFWAARGKRAFAQGVYTIYEVD